MGKWRRQAPMGQGRWGRAARPTVSVVPIVWTDDPAANELLETDPLALLIGMVLDQQVKMEKAFAGPYELQRRLGRLDARENAGMDPAPPEPVFPDDPALHRFTGKVA